jgi:pentatricopeptide repeat protein
MLPKKGKHLDSLKATLRVIMDNSSDLPPLVNIQTIMKAYRAINKEKLSSSLTFKELEVLCRLVAEHQKLPWAPGNCRKAVRDRKSRIRAKVTLAMLLESDLTASMGVLSNNVIAAFMTIYSQAGDTDKVTSLFSILKERGCLTRESYWMVIGAFCQARDMEAAEKWLNYLREDTKMQKPGIRVFRTMIAGYLAIDDASNALKALKVLETISPNHKDLKIYGRVLEGLVKAEQFQQARSLFRQMQSKGVIFDRFCWHMFLSAHRGIDMMDVPPPVESLLKEMKNSGIEPDGSTYSTLILLHRSRNDVKSALQLLRRIPMPLAKTNRLLHTSITALLDSGSEEDQKLAWNLVERSNLCDRTHAYCLFMSHYAKESDVRRTLETCERLLHVSSTPSRIMYDALIEAYVRLEQMENAWLVYSKMLKMNVDVNRFTLNRLMMGAVRDRCWPKDVSNDFILTRNVSFQGLTFKNMNWHSVNFILREMHIRNVKPGVDTFNIILTSILRQCDFFTGLEFLELYPESPDAITYTLLLQAYLQQHHIDHHSQLSWLTAPVFDLQIQSNTTKPTSIPARIDSVLYSRLINLYYKSSGNNIESCTNLFQDMLTRGIYPTATVFESLIAVYARRGHVQGALNTYKMMINFGAKPSIHTFTSLMTAFHHKDTPEPFLPLYDTVESRSFEFPSTSIGAFQAICLLKMKPNFQAFRCLLLAYSNQGDWNRAYETFMTMKEHGFVPDTGVYHALLLAAKGDETKISLVHTAKNDLALH